MDALDASAAIDEELLALSEPPVSLRYGLVTLLVIALSIVMLVWFFPEFKYLMAGIGGPRQLGDAADVDLSTLESNVFVSVEGIPWVTKTVAYNDGIKWFALSDTSRKLFPLMGQRKLLVRWTVPQKNKVYRDPQSHPSSPSLPGYFEGHLLRYDKYSSRYQHIWDFMNRELNFQVSKDTWLLIDGEMPIDKIWVLIIYGVLLVMIGVNAYKFYRFLLSWRA
ncbi:MAG: hypothetical protein GY762_15075 [Proteobacteria bacterium]|nr:hypothetical protein [Pseudomonadota bacterium]